MDWKLFLDKFHPWVVNMAGLHSTYVNRIAAVNIMCAASVVSAEKKCFEKLFLRSYMELCTDPDLDIRKTALTNLKFIMQKLEPSSVEKTFSAEFADQAKDSNQWIRFIVFELIVKFHKLFSTSYLENDIIPLLTKEFSNKWTEIDNWLFKNCGSVVNFLIIRELLNKDLISNIFSFFKLAVASKEVEFNLITIKNLAPIIEMEFISNPEAQKYSKILNELAIGPLYQKAVLEIIPDVVRIHSAYKKIELVYSILSALMQNENHSFSINLISKLAKVMNKIFSEDVGKEIIQSKFKQQIMHWIKELWISIKSEPGQHLRDLIELIPQFQDYFDIEEYTVYFMKEMLNIIKNGKNIEKKLASISYCSLYVKNYLSESREASLNELLELSESFTYSQRQAVVYFIEASFNYFSLKFLIEKQIIKTYLSLGTDKISNVRIAFSQTARKAARIIIFDSKIKSDFNTLLITLQNDKDKDVRRMSKDAYKELKQPLKKNEAEEEFRQNRENELIKREIEVNSFN